MKTFITFSFISFTALAGPQESKDFDAKGLNEVSVTNTSGKVTIQAVEGNKAHVTAIKNKFSDRCKLTMDRSGDELTVKVEKSGFFSSEDCDVDLLVKVPKAVDLDLTIGAGKLAVNGVEGELDFKIGSGNVTAEGLFKEIDGKSGNGRIEIKGLAGGGELKTGAGGIDLTFAQKPLAGALDLKTGSGNATLNFPKGAKVKTDFQAGSGQLSNQLGESENAPFSVSMKAGSGDLKIKTY